MPTSADSDRLQERVDALEAELRAERQATRARHDELESARRELAENHAFLEAIIENIPDMIFVKDARDLRFVRFNRAGEQLLGWSRQELLGKSDADFFPPDEADFFLRKDREVLEAGVAVDIAREPIATRFKGVRTLHTKKVPLLDDRGQPAFLLGISEDITDRERAEAIQREFVSVVSHELRTPLTSIRAALGLLASQSIGPIDGEALRLVEIARDNTERLVRLVHDILDIERLATGELQLRVDSVLARELARDTCRALAPLADARHVRLAVVTTEPTLLVRADTDRIIQVLTNLVSNAIRHTPEKTCVTVTVGSVGADRVRFEVHDEGQGVPEQHRDRLFQRFSRFEIQSGRESGAGLGLAIAKGIVEQHGGTIGLDTESEAPGATFWFELARDG